MDDERLENLLMTYGKDVVNNLDRKDIARHWAVLKCYPLIWSLKERVLSKVTPR